MAVLTTRLVFDRSLNPRLDIERAAVARLQGVISARARRWSAGVVAWNPNPRARATVEFDQANSLADAVAERTRTNLGFNSGSVELRGATGEFVVVVSVNDRPTRPVGGRLLMPNEITVQVLGASVEGASSVEFSVAIFEELCIECVPLWGAVHLDSEYTSKVMQTTPSIRAIGRDFGRFLPGLFAVNYFDNRCLELAPEISAMRGIRKVEHGAVLTVADPLAWEDESGRYLTAIAKIGQGLFFDRTAPDRPTVAPTFTVYRE